jgi:phage I-like protein
MSLTLRDAQHLSWKTFKKFELVDEKSAAKIGTVEALASKVAGLTQKMKLRESSEVIDEDRREAEKRLLSELLFNAFILAERSGVELEDSFLQTVDEIILGFVS